MDILDTIRATFVEAGVKLVAFASPYSIISYIGALAVFGLMLTVSHRRLPRWRAFLKNAFPKKIFGHQSTSADIRLFILNFLVLSSAYGLAIVGTEFWSTWTSGALKAVFGQQNLPAPVWLILVITTLAEIIMVDLGYWSGHYLMHKVPALWEFHKVHHSAEVMTPLTEWRQHPVEMVLIPNTISFANGATYGLLNFLFGSAQPLTLWQSNILLVIFFLTISHLRHSHVWLPFTGWLGHLLHSPAHHQIHHSVAPEHHDKNLGFALSLWDWLFGTLWIPRDGERVTLGIGAESPEFHNLSGSLVGPFVKAARHASNGEQVFKPTMAAPAPPPASGPATS